MQSNAGASTGRGGIGAFNANWDGDWDVKAQVTERGWEAEMIIPLQTLRYPTGVDRTWGFNVMRNIRHKNEQVYLAPIPRGFDIYRVSMAAKLGGLNLPGRRDISVTPYALGSVNKDYTRLSDQLDPNGDVGFDLKWGVRPNLTFDATVNTDFAQVEADEEQVNLTRFDVFFPEKRTFFLENASTFQFGSPQAIDLFFSRRIGLSQSGQPIDILGGGRLSGKIGRWNVGVLDVQTADARSPNGVPIAPSNNFGVLRTQREIGRSNIGGLFVNRQATGSLAGDDNWNRTYGLDGNWQASTNQRISAFVARTDTPEPTGSDHAARAFYNFTNDLWLVAGGYSQVGENFNPEVGFLPRRGYRRPEMRVFFQPQPKGIPWIRRIAPHMNYNSYYGLDGELQTAAAHLHALEIQPSHGGRFGWYMDYAADNPTQAFNVYNRDGRRVVIPAGQYDWWQQVYEFLHDPSAAVTGTMRFRLGNYYDGDYNALELTAATRVGSRFTASAGWTRQDVDLPGGAFVVNLVPLKATYAFTTLANIQALVQYNGQTAQLSANVRLAILDRSNTGFYIVYNDRRDRTVTTPQETLGRSLVIKYTEAARLLIAPRYVAFPWRESIKNGFDRRSRRKGRRNSGAEPIPGVKRPPMHCIEIRSPGGPEVLQPVDREDPVPGRGEVLIHVEAAGVNRPDVLQRRGRYPVPPGASDIPGLEVAGTVAALGDGVQSWRVGDRVCALVAGGGYATLCVAPAAQCLPVPAPLDFVSAAAVPETFFTVWTNVFDRGRLQAGRKRAVSRRLERHRYDGDSIGRGQGRARVRDGRVGREVPRVRRPWSRACDQLSNRRLRRGREASHRRSRRGSRAGYRGR